MIHGGHKTNADLLIRQLSQRTTEETERTTEDVCDLGFILPKLKYKKNFYFVHTSLFVKRAELNTIMVLLNGTHDTEDHGTTQQYRDGNLARD